MTFGSHETGARTAPAHGRRRLLRIGAGLGVACALGRGTAHGNPRWSFDELQPPPEGRDWRILDADDHGHVPPDWSDPDGRLDHRVGHEPAPDGRAAFRHDVRRDEVVEPLGIDSPVLPLDFAGTESVLLRYHTWITAPSFIDGKWVGLMLGRGWVGDDYPRPADAVYGEDGAGVNVMHPGRPAGNGVRLLGSHVGQRKPYGTNFGDGKEIVPLGRWLTIDTVADRTRGYRLYVDGRETARSEPLAPMAHWETARAVWYRIRLMHGGRPEELRALNDYREWLGGFFVGVA